MTRQVIDSEARVVALSRDQWDEGYQSLLKFQSACKCHRKYELTVKTLMENIAKDCVRKRGDESREVRAPRVQSACRPNEAFTEMRHESDGYGSVAEDDNFASGMLEKSLESRSNGSTAEQVSTDYSPPTVSSHSVQRHLSVCNLRLWT